MYIMRCKIRALCLVPRPYLFYAALWSFGMNPSKKTNASLRVRHYVLASALTLGLLAACSNDNTQQAAGPGAMPPMPVTVLEVAATAVPGWVEVNAQTEGAREAEVRPRVGGILLKRLYQEGQVVQAGQPLFQLDRTPFENALS